jgi:hypothetical protein
MRVKVAAANFSPAVACRRDNMMITSGFKFSWGHSHSTHNILFDVCSRLGLAIQEERAAPRRHTRRTQKITFRLGADSAESPLGQRLM